MEFINVQSLTLLTTVVAVISNILSLNESIAKNGIVKSLKITTYYLLPIIFIKQIILFVYDIKCLSIIIISTIPILILFATIRKSINFCKIEDKIFIFVTFVTAIILISQVFIPTYGIDNYNSLICDFVTKFREYKISISMYEYMIQNLFCTMCLIIDVIEIILFLYISIKELIYYKRYIFKNNSISIDLEIDTDLKNMLCKTIALFILVLFSKQTINYILMLF